MQTSKAVLKLSDYFAASGMTPMEAHKQIKWAFKALDKAPHKLKAIDTIVLTESGITIEVQNMSAKKVIKVLKNSKFSYYKITSIDGKVFECGKGFTSIKEEIDQSVIDLVHLFTED